MNNYLNDTNIFVIYRFKPVHFHIGLIIIQRPPYWPEAKIIWVKGGWSPDWYGKYLFIIYLQLIDLKHSNRLIWHIRLSWYLVLNLVGITMPYQPWYVIMGHSLSPLLHMQNMSYSFKVCNEYIFILLEVSTSSVWLCQKASPIYYI